MDDQPLIESNVQPKPIPRPKKQEKKVLPLNIPERLLTLTIDDDHAEITASAKATLSIGLAGALLSELVIERKFHLENSRLMITDPIPTGDALLDEFLVMVTSEQKQRKLSRWVDDIGQKLTVKQVAKHLAEGDVIVVEKKRHSWVIPYNEYPQVEASAKYWIKQHLRGIVLAGEKAELADIVMLSMLKATRLLHLVFTRDERKFAAKKVDVFRKGEVHGEDLVKVLADLEEITTVVAASASSS